MTIRHLRIFVEVAETGKMSAAAEHCYISQPTVSQAIRELEEHYHVRLFERLSKKLYITDAGQQLLDYAYKVLNQYDLLESNMQAFHTDSQLRIGATITIGACLLSSILLDLKREIPALQTYACVANTSLIEKKLLNSELDIAIVEGTIQSPDLIALPIVDDFLVLAVSKSHPLTNQKEIPIEELSRYDFVIREKGSGTRNLFENFMKNHGIPFRITWEATCLDAIKSAVLYNNCISAISVRLLEQEIQKDLVHIIKDKKSQWNRNFYLVYHKDKYYSDSMRLLEKVLHTYKCPDFLKGKEVGYLIYE